MLSDRVVVMAGPARTDRAARDASPSAALATPSRRRPPSSSRWRPGCAASAGGAGRERPAPAAAVGRRHGQGRAARGAGARPRRLLRRLGAPRAGLRRADLRPAAPVDDPLRAGRPAGLYWRNTLVTAKEALLGYLVALALALSVGSGDGSVPLPRARVDPGGRPHPGDPDRGLRAVGRAVARPRSRPWCSSRGCICLVPLVFAVTSGLRSADPAALDLMAIVDAAGSGGRAAGAAPLRPPLPLLGHEDAAWGCPCSAPCWRRVRPGRPGARSSHPGGHRLQPDAAAVGRDLRRGLLGGAAIARPT